MTSLPEFADMPESFRFITNSMSEWIRRSNTESYLLDRFIPSEPVAQQRPFFVGRHAIKKSKSAKYETFVRGFIRSTLPDDWPREEMVCWVALCFCRGVPKSYPKWKTLACLVLKILPVGVPDLDNYIKGILDSLGKKKEEPPVVWRDDASVVGIVSHKCYAEVPGVFVRVMVYPYPKTMKECSDVSGN